MVDFAESQAERSQSVSIDKPVILVEYKDQWPQTFLDEKAKLQEQGGELIVATEHVGSTAVPGLIAKPIIDILLGVHTLGDAVQLIEAFSGMGYKYTPQHEEQLPERRFMHRPGFHLHMTEYGNHFWRRHMFFRDYLRQNPSARNEYAQLKTSLAERFKNDRPSYTDSKTDFILQIVSRMSEE